MTQTIKSLALLISLISVATPAFAQNNVKSPEVFFPFKYGEQFTPHHLLVDYFRHVAENHEQVILSEYGRTNEQRPLVWAIISSPENLANLEQIRTDNLKRAKLLEGKPSGSRPVAIVWLSYGVHGNEAGASESAIATLYEMVRPGNEKMKTLLENTVVIIDPCINPDGYSRYTHWQWQINNKIANPNPESAEHIEPWPKGRFNHYLFDLNRDWAWFTQIETNQRLEIYNQWLPHIHVDFHEMGHESPYYFAPAAQPYHDYITDWQADFQIQIGLNNARYFDKMGWLYYTREDFDLFYPSYGDTYPTFNGSIGMTYEQGGHSMAGRAIILKNGDTLKLSDRIEHHKTTGIATIESAARNAERLVKNFENYFAQSVQSPKGKYKTFIIPKTNSKDNIKALCRFLDKHQIRYGSPETEIPVNAYHYASGNTQRYNISKQDLVISAFQPKSVLTQVFFEPAPFLFDSLTYDITAWALPHAFGLEAYASEQKLLVEQPFTEPGYENRLIKEDRPYAYLLEWQSLEDAKFLSALLNRDIRVRFANNPFELDDKKFGLGTLIVTRADNRHNPGFDATIVNLAHQFEREVIAVKSGFASSGNDLGSNENQLIRKPEIAVFQGDQVSPNSFGYVWHYLENDLQYPVTILPLDNLRHSDLKQYNLIILPEGSYNAGILNMEKLRGWISAGGKLIVTGTALSAFENEAGFTLEKYATAKEKGDAAQESETMTLEKRLQPYADRKRSSISDHIPGAIFKLRIDNTHPLGYGMPDYYFTLKTNMLAYKFLKNTWNVGYIEKSPLILGFAGANTINKMEETTVFGVQSMGQGEVIYLVDNPLFRGFWRHGKFLFSNAVFFRG